MDFYSYLNGRKTNCIAEDAEVLNGKTLEQHDAVHHPNGYKEGDICKFRDRIEEESKPDDFTSMDPTTGLEKLPSAISNVPQRDDDRLSELMSPERCSQMIRRAFVIGNMGEYRDVQNADEWLKRDGAEDVAMIVENYSELYHEYIEPIQDELGEFSIEDVIRAYQEGKLTGKVKKNPQSDEESKLDITESPRVSDERFYSQSAIEATKKDLDLAMRKAIGKDKDAVYDARGKVLMFSHNKGAAEKLGLTQTSLNRMLRAWSAYPANARDLSIRLNDDVGESAQWYGMENMANLTRFNARKYDVAELVKSIDGDSNQFQRNYIARTMLALDTHIDYSGLSFEFTYGNISSGRSDHCNGIYKNSEKKIVCKMNAASTVAHEMGHYLDHKWAEDLGVSRLSSFGMTDKLPKNIRDKDSEIGKFCQHFDDFMADINNSADESSAYTLERSEIFARFVSRFVEWTEKKATSRNYTFSDNFFQDRFHEGQYIKFVRLLQEKSYLDAKRMVKSNS